jgi:2-polyprenyl-3-methyl-5-hydroxy-6-metoxy-1,4-benzoquinol methylase
VDPVKKNKRTRMAVQMAKSRNTTPGRGRGGRKSCYEAELERFLGRTVPPNASVLHVGCGDGSLLASLSPSRGVGVDACTEQIRQATNDHAEDPALTFTCVNINQDVLSVDGPFDYILMADILPFLDDAETFLMRLAPLCDPSTRLVITSPSNLWHPLLRFLVPTPAFAQKRRLDWLSRSDIANLLYLADFEPVSEGTRVLLPFRVPLLARFCNHVLSPLPLLRHLCLSVNLVARRRPDPGSGDRKYAVSVVIPTRNEKGNIEACFTQTPKMGSDTQLVFVDGHSEDGTQDEIRRCMDAYRDRWPDVTLITQTGSGKGNAVREGFDVCDGDVLMILDSDLTMPPQELPKYYHALASGKGELVNGCRLVYQMETRAMRFLNMVANHVFAHLFTWLLGQRIKDTLCGTKVLLKADYDLVAANRHHFGDFDPFGDFDLLFGAARLHRKIVDVPIHYRERTYGDIKIHRWRHGWLLLRMSLIAFRKLKLG